jgi:hypothetical protein
MFLLAAKFLGAIFQSLGAELCDFEVVVKDIFFVFA